MVRPKHSNPRPRAQVEAEQAIIKGEAFAGEQFETSVRPLFKWSATHA